jgi:undecaprenyl-diphosphatase
VEGLALNILFSIVVGIVQGVAEWLPISSKTQVLLASTVLFGLPLAVAYAFGLFMEIGSVLSALTYFRKDVSSALILKDRRLLTYLVVVTAVTAFVAVPIYLAVEKLLENPYNVGAPMIVLGAVLIANGLYIRHSRINPKIEGLEQMKMKHYIAVGLAQGIAAFPGVSRSGMTTSTMLLMGVKPDVAFRLSFLAYIPSAVGAFMVTVLLSRAEVRLAIATINLTGILIAITTAAVTGLLVISYLLRVAKHNKVYLINFALGLVALAIGLVTALSTA